MREALKKAAELREKVAAEHSLDIGDRAVKRKKDKVQAVVLGGNLLVCMGSDSDRSHRRYIYIYIHIYIYI